MGSSLITAGSQIGNLAKFIGEATGYLFAAIITFVVAALLLRYLTEALQLSPFGRFAYYATRPANEMLRNMRQSRFHFPLKRAFGFDPAMIMLLLGTAILCYVAQTIISNLTTVLEALADSLRAFGNGHPFIGACLLVGTILLAGVFYLMALMTLVFIHWLLGVLSRAAYSALHRIGPLLSLFEFGGVLAGFSFLILWFVLILAQSAIQFVFLHGLGMF